MSLTAALDAAGIAADDLGLIDLYSCFPIAVEVAAKGLGIELDDPRGLTITGGLPFFGGPGNNYSLHAIATLFVLGLAIGVAYERFKGLGVPIAMHAGFNAINIALVLWVVAPAPQQAAPFAPQNAPDGFQLESDPANPPAAEPESAPAPLGWRR